MAVTLLPQGVSNANTGSLGITFPAPDPTRVISFFDDFYRFDGLTTAAAADWRVVGAATVVVPTLIDSVVGGRILVAPTGGTGSTFIQYAGQSAAAAGSTPVQFQFVAGRDVWFQTLFQISNANLSGITAGLTLPAASDPNATADGVFFTKASGTTTLSLKAIKTGASNSTVSVATLADATDIKIGFHYNSTANQIFAYVNDVRVAALATTNMPTASLTPTIGHLNNTASRTSSWDFVHVAQGRQSEAVT